jgi:hypothetical protein
LTAAAPQGTPAGSPQGLLAGNYKPQRLDGCNWCGGRGVLFGGRFD